jgi:hypothetical protein
MIGSQTINVPKRMLDFFLGPKPTSLELFCGPPALEGSKEPAYFKLTFKYRSFPHESIYMPIARPTAWIIIRGGRLEELTTIEETSETDTTYTDFDPETLKEIRKSTGKISK